MTVSGVALLPGTASAAAPDSIWITTPYGLLAPGSEATIVASVYDANFDPVPGVEITFQVLRDSDGDFDLDTDLGSVGSDQTGDDLDDDGDPVTEAPEEATLDYTGPAAAATDYVIVCPDTDADGCATLDGFGWFAADPDEGSVYGYDTLEWGVLGPTWIDVQTPFDPVAGGSSATVVASVYDQQYDPLSGVALTFQVLRDSDGDFDLDTDLGPLGSDVTGDGLDDDGDPVTEAPEEATLDYTGPAAAATDYVIVCPDTDADGCATLDGFGWFAADPDEGSVYGYDPVEWFFDPDTDGDGVTDSQDPCPTEPGPASNFGCPPVVGPNGPVVLAGIDAEDGGVFGHGPLANYVKLVKSILADVGNGDSDILVIGGGKSPSDDVTSKWDAIGAATGRSITYANGAAAVASQSFAGFAMLAVASSVSETYSGGLTDAENVALAARSADVAAFVNNGGGLLGFSQTGLSSPWSYIADIGAFSQNTGLGYDDINPTPGGEAVGITNDLDICCWHDEFTAWPDWLDVLAYNAQSAEDPPGAAALGGSSVTVAPQTLTVAKGGNGTGSVSSDPAGIDCGGTCAADFGLGLQVTLAAVADVGSTFTGWGGDGAACGVAAECQVTMDAAKTVTATFTADVATHELIVSTGGTGTGSVSSAPAGIDCGADCSEVYDEGTLVTLTATADGGSTFTGWGGDGAACGVAAECQVTMDAAKTVTATFTLDLPDETTTTYTGDSSVQYSDAATLSGTLTETAGGAPVPGKVLDFTLGTQNASAGPTNASGNASTSLVVTQTPGSVSSVETAFAGDAGFGPSSDTDPFEIAKEDCTVTYTGDTLVNAVNATNLRAQFGEPDASPGDWTGRQITFTVTDSAFNSQTFTALTNGAGIAEIAAPLGPDVYGVNVLFQGDDYYLGCQTATDTLVTVQSAAAKITGGGFVAQTVGNTHFGFNVIPDVTGLHGQLQIRAKGGKDRFHSTTVLTLSTSANTGTWTGTGKWNGTAGYSFTVSVVDNGSSGKKKGDTISIVIKSPSNVTVFTTSGAQPLKGGNITVH